MNLDPGELLDDDDYLDMAEHAARTSKNQWTKDGACLVHPSGRVISMASNSAEAPSEPAEIAAIMNTDEDLTDCEVFITRWYPTDETLGILASEGIKRIIAYAPSIEINERRTDEVLEFLTSHGMSWTRVYRYFFRLDDLFGGGNE